VAFHTLVLVVEAPLIAWSERVRIRWFSAGSLAAVAVTSALAALAHGPWMLLLALALYGPAVGCALASAEGALLLLEPVHPDRLLARMGLGASLGDLAVPALLAALAAIDCGWRTAFGVCAFAAAILAVVHARMPSLDRLPRNTADEGDDEEPGTTILQSLRLAVRAPGLLVWSLACAWTNLLDEVLVAFAAIQLHALGGSASLRSVGIAAWTGGGMLGLALLERMAGRVDRRRLLAASSVLTGAALLVLATAPSPIVGAVAFAAEGLFGASLHPLSKSAAYASLPGRTAPVNALAAALVPLDLASPIVLGFVAAHLGPRAAVGMLLVAPLGILAAAAFSSRTSSGGPGSNAGSTAAATRTEPAETVP
jgi:MFS family permease